jgi:rhodanese-related sulfurtransferase
MTYQHLSASQVHQMRQRGDDIVMIDVREQYEHDVARIDGSLLCPISTSAQWIDRLDRDKLLVIFCHHGIRSEQVAAALTSRFGYTTVATMDGGIDDWSCRVDPTIPRY